MTFARASLSTRGLALHVFDRVLLVDEHDTRHVLPDLVRVDGGEAHDEHAVPDLAVPGRASPGPGWGGPAGDGVRRDDRR